MSTTATNPRRDDMQALVDRLRETMRAMTVAALAAKTGEADGAITPDTLHRILDGKRGISYVEADEIAAVLNIDTYWLIHGKPDPLAVR